MPICRGCGATIKESTPDCPYCGVRNSVDFQAVSDSTTEVPQENRMCPNCKVKLKTIDIGEGEHFYIENCSDCGGIFFDTGELQAVLEQHVRGAVRINYQGLDRLLQETLPSTIEVRYRSCPVCGDIMNREKFGEKSGVIVDHCRAHGIWLEAGELTRLKAWKKEGGEILDAKRKYEEERRRLKEQQQTLRNSEPSGSFYSNKRGSGLGSSDGSFLGSVLGGFLAGFLDELFDW